MRVIVFGAAGRTGRHVVAKALGHGHEVTAFIRKTQINPDHPRLTVVSGDVRDSDAVRHAMVEQDAVAFALSATSGGANIHETGIASVVFAMAEQRVPRLAAISAAGTFDRSNPRLSLAYRAKVATVLRATYDDLEAMERRIMATDLAWTIVRPVGLTDEPASGHYRVSLDGSLLPKAKGISREDVASLTMKALETDTYWRRAVVIAR